MTQASEQPQLGDRVMVRGQIGTVDSMRTDPLEYRISFADKSLAVEWWDAESITQLPREPNLLELIAGAITDAERDFSYRVGAGQVEPGSYLSDKDKATSIVSALHAAGYKIVKDA